MTRALDDVVGEGSSAKLSRTKFGVDDDGGEAGWDLPFSHDLRDDLRRLRRGCFPADCLSNWCDPC